MKFLILVFFILLSYPAKQQYFFKAKTKLAIPHNIDKKNYSKDVFYIYRAMTSGNKRGLNRKLKTVMKNFGLMHILTPSGIHLSSVLSIFRFTPKISFFFFLIIFCFIFYSENYLSMERVLLFKLLYKIFSKVGLFNIELIFIFCITSSLFMGHFQRSPLSFIYSVAFWGVIVIFRKHPFKMIIHLNFMLYFVNSFTATSVSALSIFINPLVTSVVSCLFPFLFINAFLPDWIQLNEIVSFIINHLKDFLFFIDKIDIFPKISIETYIIVTFFILQRLFSFKIALVFLLIFYIPASPQKTK